MNKNILSTIILTLFALSVQAQSDFFVYTKDKKMLKGDEVQYVSKLFKSPYFRVGKQKVKAKDVLFYKNEDGFFGKIRRSNEFASRLEKGNINIFLHESYDYNNNGFNNYGYPIRMNSGFGMMNTRKKENYYYNMDEFEPVKRVNYKNLVQDLKSNKNSMSELKMYNKKRFTEYGMYLIGAAATLYGLNKVYKNGFNGSNNNSFFNTGTTVTISGILTMGIGSLVARKRREHLINAIEIYNE